MDVSTARKIIHLDMDCFYAAIEARDNPALRGKAIAVGGSPDARGVVATCSYEARRFGVHSAMPMSLALRKCPDLIVVQSRMAVYKQVSDEVRDLLAEYTDKIEPLSWDEAYLDVSNSPYFQGSATRIAEDLRQRILNTQELTASAGVAPNKFLAKVASDWRKPNGLFVIHPRHIESFMLELPVKRIPGVGKVTEAKLKRMGVVDCAQLQSFSVSELEREFGRLGHRLYELSRGIDTREVESSSIRKSLSVEDTFRDDLPTLDACLKELPALYSALMHRLERAQKRQYQLPKALFVKMRFQDFVTTTAQTLSSQINIEIFQVLLTQAWERGQRSVRLLGVGIQFEEPGAPEQLELSWDAQKTNQP